MRIGHNLTKNGQSMVELAILLPILLLISVVVLDLGRGIYYYSAIYNAAREGARYGIINPDDITGIQDAALNLAVGLNLHRSDISVVPDPPNQNIQTITVNINYSFELVTPIAKIFTQCACGIIPLQTSSTMYIER